MRSFLDTCGKSISTASAPIRYFYIQLMGAVLVHAVTVCLVYLSQFDEVGDDRRSGPVLYNHEDSRYQVILRSNIITAQLLLVCLASGLRPTYRLRFINYVGLVITALFMLDECSVSYHRFGYDIIVFVKPTLKEALIMFAVHLPILSFFVGSEADRMLRARLIQESE